MALAKWVHAISLPFVYNHAKREIKNISTKYRPKEVLLLLRC